MHIGVGNILLEACQKVTEVSFNKAKKKKTENLFVEIGELLSVFLPLCVRVRETKGMETGNRDWKPKMFCDICRNVMPNCP